MANEGYQPGNHWVQCDECGFKVRANETRIRWDGMRVCLKDWEPRHPQDFVRGRRDRQRVPNPRPESPDVFVTIDAVLDENGIPSGGTPPDTSAL